MFKELIRNKIDIVKSVSNWEEAIRKGAQLLLDNKCIEPRYVDSIIKNIKETGPYVILGDGMAMSHARPEDGVLKNGITLLKIVDGVDFDNDNKIFLLFTLAAENNDHHQELVEEIADLLNESEKIKRIMYDDLTDLEIYDIILQ
ncbi:PTS sugar transporter subunit IIA [Brachyspira alvinipulli]|uniref:PTS sugar transporter subunit IIA n=1 Tax=Brachyspira alvinipulli TaxID=84379 RepID=UPI00048584EA|nr:PTS sugar transporter subunit IIA [Brachyspira alvinipulli]